MTAGTDDMGGEAEEVGQRQRIWDAAADHAPIVLAHEIVGSGPPLLLVMGLGADRGAWSRHVTTWSRRFTCIEVDNRGSGLSPRPDGPYSTTAMAADYAALLDELDLGPVDVVGISMGGAIAQELALIRPELVRRLVLTASWARCAAYTKEVLTTLALARATLPVPEYVRVLQEVIWTPAWFERHAEELAADRAAPQPVSVRALAAQAAACSDHDALARIRTLRVPTLVTAGRSDRFVPLAASVELAEAIPGSVLEVFGDTGHVHHFEELTRYNTLVERWLSA